MKKASKRILSVFLAIALIFSSAYVGLTEVDFGKLFAVRTHAANVVNSGTCGDNLTWTLDDEGTLTISGTGEMASYSYNSNAPWYSNKANIYSVVIEDGVTSIGNYAFYGCTNLTSIIIPDSVTSICDYAFYNCTSLASVKIPDSVTSMGNYAFYGCTKLKDVYITDLEAWCGISFARGDANPLYKGANLYLNGELVTDLVIPDSVTSIGNYVFYKCTSLTSIEIPEGVTSIGMEAFYGCTKLKDVYITDLEAWNGISFSNFSSNPMNNGANLYLNGELVTDLVIPDSVTSIGNYAFVGCTSLTSITIPNTVTNIGNCAFRGCTNLTSISIPNSVTNIGDYAFYNCANLTSITIPDCVATIGDFAFGYCENLTSIAIPDSVISIGDYAFSSCSNLTSVDFGDGVTSIGDFAFASCTSLASVAVPYNVTSIGGNAFSACKSLVSVSIENGEIGQWAFSNCTNLKAINIGSGVTRIGDMAFDECESLESIYITDVAAWCDIDFVDNPMYTADNLYLDGELIVDLIIPDGVTSIPHGAFYGCTSITSVTIPNTVTSIGTNAFYGCTGLTSIEIPDGVTSISSSAFGNCTNLTSIIIPDSVTDIGLGAFENTEYYNSSSNWENNVLYINNHLIKANTSISGNYAIKEGTKTVADNAFYKCSSLTSVTIPDGVTNIGNQAFYYCTNLASITIPDSIVEIGSAFYDCKNLKDVYITDIAAWCEITFSHNYSNPLCFADNFYLNGELITALVIPDGVTRIASYTFQNWASLTSVTIPDSVTSIGVGVFGNSGYYNDVSNWENDVLYIDNHLIAAKTSITGDYTIKEGTKTIADSAFKGCTNLASIIISNSVTNISDNAFYNCKNITSIAIPGSVTSLSSNAFTGCAGLNAINVDESNLCYSSLDGVLFNKDKTALILYPNGKYSDYIIPDSVISIEASAFFGCKGLVSITIPDSVKRIGKYGFGYCTSLTTISIPDGVTTIDDCAFLGCTGLTSISIPGSVTFIGDGTFSDCTGLKDVYYDGTASDWEKIIIEGNNSCLTDATIHFAYINPEDYLTFSLNNDGESYSVTGCDVSASGKLIIPDIYNGLSVTGIGTSAFASCTALTSIVIPDSVISISFNAFGNCTGLTSITIPDSVTSMASFAFSDCENLEYVEIGKGLTEIAGEVFGRCTSLTDVSIPDNITIIYERAFTGCTSLKSITIPNRVTYICNGAFSGCTSLKSIVIPESVTEIFTGAFKNCASDFTIYCYRDTYAMQYAIDNSMNYVIMDIGATENCTIDYENKRIFSTVNGITSLEDMIYVPGTSVAFVEASLISGNYEFIGTGSIVTVFDGDEMSEYTVVVNGDTNGDSVCDALDAAQVALASSGHTSLGGAYGIAADNNGDGVVDINDYQAVVNKAVS